MKKLPSILDFSIDDSIVPQHTKDAFGQIAMDFKSDLMFVDIKDDIATAHYNIPLRDHSMKYKIAHNLRTKETTLEFFAFGHDEGDRFSESERVVAITALMHNVKIIAKPTYHNTTFHCKLEINDNTKDVMRGLIANISRTSLDCQSPTYDAKGIQKAASDFDLNAVEYLSSIQQNHDIIHYAILSRKLELYKKIYDPLELIMKCPECISLDKTLLKSAMSDHKFTLGKAKELISAVKDLGIIVLQSVLEHAVHYFDPIDLIENCLEYGHIHINNKPFIESAVLSGRFDIETAEKFLESTSDLLKIGKSTHKTFLYLISRRLELCNNPLDLIMKHPQYACVYTESGSTLLEIAMSDSKFGKKEVDDLLLRVNLREIEKYSPLAARILELYDNPVDLIMKYPQYARVHTSSGTSLLELAMSDSRFGAKEADDLLKNVNQTYFYEVELQEFYREKLLKQTTIPQQSPEITIKEKAKAIGNIFDKKIIQNQIIQNQVQDKNSSEQTAKIVCARFCEGKYK
jgi:hypothetical protein